MNVTCPQCSTVYRLPDEKAKVGTKLRCSVCRHVFVLPEPEPVLLDNPVTEDEDAPLSMGAEQSEKDTGLDMDLHGLPDSPAQGAAAMSGLSLDGTLPGQTPAGLDIAMPQGDHESSAPEETVEDSSEEEQIDMPEQKPSRFEGMAGLLLCIAIILGGIWAWTETDYLDGLKTLVEPYVEQVEAPAAPSALIEKLELLDVRQYQEKNEKIGRIIVIEGKVKNNFTEARELIRLEAELYGPDGKVLVSRSQVAGICLGSSLLKVLDKAELENALNSKPGIAAANVNVLSGMEVPFMIVFADIPEGASDYKVRIAEASAPKPVGNLDK